MNHDPYFYAASYIEQAFSLHESSNHARSKYRPVRLSLCSLRLSLALLTIPLLQSRHPRLADLRIAGIEGLEVLRRHYRRQLHFRDGLLLDLVVLRIGCIGVAICCTDKDRRPRRGGGVL